jgi:hypothetical protein
MATALQLNAASTIINGQGLSASTDLLTQIAAFQNLESVTLVNAIFTLAANSASNLAANSASSHSTNVIGTPGTTQANVNTGNVVLGQLACLGNTATQGHFLLDLYPPGATKACSTAVATYGSYTIMATDPEQPLSPPVPVTISDANAASVSGTIRVQAELPFAHGMAGFANVFQTAYGFASQVFDPISSVHLLNTKTYANSGLGYTGPVDLATGGLGSAGNVLAKAIGTWGTMYDINKLGSISDPYVFGQNLLNQGLGTVGNLAAQFTQVGLNTSDITKIPVSVTQTTTEQTTVSTQTPVGEVALPALTTVTTTSQAGGVSTDVIMNIYAGIAGADLQTLIMATGITIPASSQINNLADFLTFSKVIDASVLPELSLGTYLHRVAGQGYFASWTSLSRFLQSIVVPVAGHTQTASTDLVLSSTTISTITAQTGVGTGPFGNPIMADYFGAAAGMPYAPGFQSLVENYPKIQTAGLITALRNLENTVKLALAPPEEFLGSQNTSTNMENAIPAAVQAVNSALNTIPRDAAFMESEATVTTMLGRLATEVQSLIRAGVTFDAGYAQGLMTFGLNIGSTASDTTKLHTYEIFANITSPDAAGDVIRSVIAEQINLGKFQGAGIMPANDPDPGLALTQSQSRKIPLSTYITQNQ